MRVPELQPVAAAAAAALLAASLGWWLFSAPEAIDPGAPMWKGADIVRLQAAVPEIADFKEFYVNNDNPFVPFASRGPERIRLDPSRRIETAPQPPQKKPPVPLRPAPEIVQREAPVLELPKLKPAPSDAPLTYGLVVTEGQETIFVRMPSAPESITMRPGDKVGGWTLVSIDNGNLATFLDPLGTEQRFEIGHGDLAAATGEGGAAVVDPKAKAVPGHGPVPRPPGSGGMNGRPGAGPSDGAIPRPPGREERKRREQPPANPPGTPPPANQPPPKR